MEQKDLKLSGYRQLEQLRQEYESLPVPLEARDRILAGIAQGKIRRCKFSEKPKRNVCHEINGTRP